jgi:riboflavin kinase/FMN adenylyltransferase
VHTIHYPDDPRPASWHQPVLALGNFDGLHRGHTKIIERVRRRSDERGGVAVALTFDPHPTHVVRPDKAPKLLMTKAQKLEALEQAGMDGVAIVPFTRELSLWGPEEFVERVLVDWLRVAEVWVGANFLFGHDRAGNFSLLRLLGARDGFRTEKIDPVRYKDFVVSSTRIRRLVAEGRVDEAAALLGREYFIDGAVVAGDHRGRELGFPTANLETANELVPPNGVYATLLLVDGLIHPAVTNIGVRPTFGDTHTVVIETHVLDLDADLHGRQVRLAFVQRMRDERPFEGPHALREQIEADCRHARALFGRLSL